MHRYSLHHECRLRPAHRSQRWRVERTLPWGIGGIIRFFCLCILLFAPSFTFANIGVFTDVSGDTRIQRGEIYLAAMPGVEVDEDDILETGANASAQVEMNDGSLLKLGSGTRLLLADYKFDNDGNVIKAGLDALSGWLRFAVSKLQSADRRYDINTLTMTIGIRGTEGVIEMTESRDGLFLETGEVAVNAADAGSTQLRAGEFIERIQGRPFARATAPPMTFRARMPGVMQARLARRAHLLKQRGLPPRQIRRVLREDRKRYLDQHPHLRHKFEQRFHERARKNSPAREKEKERHPRRNRQE